MKICEQHAEKISKLPDVILADFTDALEKITEFLNKNPQKITKEIDDLANKYYGLLVINEQEKLNETVQKIYNETKDEGIKTKLGELLFIHLDHLSKLPNPMHYHLAENIEKLHIAINQQKNNEKNLEKLLDQAIIAFSKLDQPTVQNSSSSVQSSESKTEKKDTPNTITETKITQNKRPPPDPHPKAAAKSRQERLAALTSRVTAANPQQLRQISKSNISNGEIPQQNAQRLAAAQSPRVNPQTSTHVDEAVELVAKNIDFFTPPLMSRVNMEWASKHRDLIRGPLAQFQKTLQELQEKRSLYNYIDALWGSQNLLREKLEKYREMDEKEVAKELKPEMFQAFLKYKKESCLRNNDPSKLKALLSENPQMLDAILAFKRYFGSG